MADNWLEKSQEDFQRRKARAEEARKALWRKQMKAYREKLKDSETKKQR